MGLTERMREHAAEHLEAAEACELAVPLIRTSKGVGSGRLPHERTRAGLETEVTRGTELDPKRELPVGSSGALVVLTSSRVLLFERRAFGRPGELRWAAPLSECRLTHFTESAMGWKNRAVVLELPDGWLSLSLPNSPGAAARWDELIARFGDRATDGASG